MELYIKLTKDDVKAMQNQAIDDVRTQVLADIEAAGQAALDELVAISQKLGLYD